MLCACVEMVSVLDWVKFVAVLRKQVPHSEFCLMMVD